MGIGFKELLIILAVALLIFGTKKLKNVGSDLGSAIKGFKKAMNDDDKDAPKPEQLTDQKDAEFHTENSEHKDPTQSRKE